MEGRLEEGCPATGGGVLRPIERAKCEAGVIQWPGILSPCGMLISGSYLLIIPTANFRLSLSLGVCLLPCP